MRTAGILATLAFVGVIGCSDEQASTNPFAPTTGGASSRTGTAASTSDALDAIERAIDAATDAVRQRPTPPPTPTTTSVSVLFPAGGTIFIGDAVQFEARETLSDGTSRIAATATWGSGNPAVATVSPKGLVTAVAAGEATIFADVNPRGEMRIRVFPDLGGAWTRTDVIVSCEDTGAFEGGCDFAPIGEPSDTNTAMFTQSDASVGAVIGGDLGGGQTVTTTGTIAVGGELRLQRAPFLPPDPEGDIHLQNWRSRADTPSRMTGTYEIRATITGLSGFLLIKVRLQDMVKATGTAIVPSGMGGGPHEWIRAFMANQPQLRR